MMERTDTPSCRDAGCNAGSNQSARALRLLDQQWLFGDLEEQLDIPCAGTPMQCMSRCQARLGVTSGRRLLAREPSLDGTLDQVSPSIAAASWWVLAS